MKNKSIVDELVEYFAYFSFDKSRVTEQIFLLVAWKILLEEKHELKLPSFEEFELGNVELISLYKKIFKNANVQFNKFFDFSRLNISSELDDTDRAVITSILGQYSEYNKEKMINDLLRLATETDLGNFSLPKEIISLVMKLVNENDVVNSLNLKKNKMLVMFDSTLQLAVSAEKYFEVIFQAEQSNFLIKLVTYLMDIETHTLDPMFHRAKNYKIEGKFDNVIMFPPMTRKKNNSMGGGLHEELSIDLGLSICNDKLITFVPQGSLFRGGEYLQLRKTAIQSGVLEAVIQFPSNVLLGTGVTPTMLVFNYEKKHTGYVFYYDATDDELIARGKRGEKTVITGWKKIASDVLNYKVSSKSRLVSESEILENKYDLSVSKYLFGPATRDLRSMENSITLDSIAVVRRAQMLKEEAEPVGEVYDEIGIRNIGTNGMITNEISTKHKKLLLLSDRMIDRAESQKLRPGDILLTTKGNVGKVGLVGNDCAPTWVANQIFQIIRLDKNKSNISPEYLYRYLASPLVQKYFREQSVGSRMAVIKTSDIKNLPIPINSDDFQESVRKNHSEILKRYSDIEEIKVEISELKNEFWGTDETDLVSND